MNLATANVCRTVVDGFMNQCKRTGLALDAVEDEATPQRRKFCGLQLDVPVKSS